jgi:hypothetical protein
MPYADRDANHRADCDLHNHTDLDTKGVSHHHGDCHPNSSTNGNAYRNSDWYTYTDTNPANPVAHAYTGSTHLDAYASQATPTQPGLSS